MRAIDGSQVLAVMPPPALITGDAAIYGMMKKAVDSATLFNPAAIAAAHVADIAALILVLLSRSLPNDP